uniref:Uncharacterized protein n=1 Tax=Kuenenia stuttgartiensis TaxID=174633 RepID=Q1Q579_KUEST|nr:unknown protein [Candidatus Kuenenia stuttgartiensis]
MFLMRPIEYEQIWPCKYDLTFNRLVYSCYIGLISAGIIPPSIIYFNLFLQ